METHFLIGSEEVSRAANTMLAAAREMQAAAGSLEWALGQHQQFLDNWLIRLQDALREVAPPEARP